VNSALRKWELQKENISKSIQVVLTWSFSTQEAEAGGSLKVRLGYAVTPVWKKKKKHLTSLTARK
jgi:hypothetical protein